jgi:DNA-binding CsgD family transcriptional regulator
MNAFSLHEYRSLNDGLMELYATHDLVELAHVSIRMIRKFVPSEFAIYTLTDPLCPESTGLYEPSDHDILKFDAPYRAFCYAHPIMLHFYRTGTSSAIRFEDTIERNALEKLDLYNQFFRPLHAKDLMGIRYRDARGRELAAGATREGRFTERDRDRLEFLRPHLSRAFANASVFAEAAHRPFSPAYLMTEKQGSMLINTVRVSDRGGIKTMSHREVEILRWISEGKSNPEIGIILDISPRTVQKHVENLFRKLNVSSRTSAAIRAIELGFSSSTAEASEYERLLQTRDRRLHQRTQPQLLS